MTPAPPSAGPAGDLPQATGGFFSAHAAKPRDRPRAGALRAAGRVRRCPEARSARRHTRESIRPTCYDDREAWRRSVSSTRGCAAPHRRRVQYRSVMVIAEKWAEQRVLMRAYSESRDQTLPTIMLHGTELAIGPAGIDVNGAWGIHVGEPHLEGAAQAVKLGLEEAARRLAGSKGNPPRLADEEPTFDREPTGELGAGHAAHPAAPAAGQREPPARRRSTTSRRPAPRGCRRSRPRRSCPRPRPRPRRSVVAPSNPDQRLDAGPRGRAAPPGRRRSRSAPRSATRRARERNRRSSGSGSRRTSRRGSVATSTAWCPRTSQSRAAERRALNALGEAEVLDARAIGHLLNLVDPVAFMEELQRKLEAVSGSATSSSRRSRAAASRRTGCVARPGRHRIAMRRQSAPMCGTHLPPCRSASKTFSPVEKKMFVEIPWETVSEKLNAQYRELGKGVALKGFRKGKVPRPVLEQVYGPRVNAEVAYELVRESFFRANQEHHLAAVAEPRVEEAAPIKKGQPFTFAAIIEVRGEVVPQDYKGLAIERRRLNVTDAQVEETLEQLRRENTELRPIEGRDVTALGDVVGLSITGKIGEHEINQPQFAVDLESEEREPLPGIRQALTGLPLDTKDKHIEIAGAGGLQGRAAARPQGRADRHVPRGPLEGRARARRRVREGHRQGRHARRAARGAAQGPRGPRAGGDRSRGARAGAARAGQEEPDPGRVLARRPLGRGAVPAAAPDARHAAGAGRRAGLSGDCATSSSRPPPTRSAASCCSRRSPTRKPSRSPTRS